MRDVVVMVGLLVSFATFVTTHVVIAARLACDQEQPRWRGPLALVVPPLAPMWAYQHKWKLSCWLWVAAVAGYAVTRTLASF